MALCVSGLLAAGFGVGISRLTAAAGPPPSLGTVPAGTLSRAGVTLAAASQPPYCDIERGAAQRGAPAGVGGCAISREQAESNLLPAFRGTVREAVLARVSGPSGSGIGQDQLVWLVVVRSNLLVLPTTYCAPPVPGGAACQSRGLGAVSNQAIVFIDGLTGQVLTTVSVAAPAAGAPAG